ncbi:DUF1801 domain-containing protein [Sphingobacterium bovistauri]|uniref:DUF1801 domain-containing protein n=1 Tax=Sphingobacterium bovistauri TaxID=2781959 RepID=A0ABS7Z8D2_9SPHI|nr:DUF1801 domain-containing protein [Sphingobacterium bovistauri]MCA5005125.1 DUF1801 domain-containing protein [Sphingobacterium bovistauri]
MPINKTTYTDADVLTFINTVDNPQKREDSLQLIQLMEEVTGEKAKMFGPSIIGFGQYHYQYASGHKGDAPLLGFSPRKAAISLYVYTGAEEHKHLLEHLGKYKVAKACIYIKKLSDINEKELITLMKASIQFISDHYTRVYN